MNPQDHRALACQRIVELVTDYIEGAMAPDDRDLFERHLDTCPHCVTYVRQMRIAIHTLGNINADDFGSSTQKELLDIFRNWKEQTAS